MLQSFSWIPAKGWRILSCKIVIIFPTSLMALLAELLPGNGGKTVHKV